MNRSEKFISKAIIDLLNHKCQIELIQSEKVTVMEDGNKIFLKGYFDTEIPKFSVAMKSGLSTFVHEYCHVKQWYENDPCFYKNSKEIDLFYKWIEDDSLVVDEKTINIGMNAVVECELNCERRAVELILKENLPINILEYIQKANAYLLFHKFMKRHRTWGSSISPDEVPEIWQSLPTTFLKDYTKLSKSLEKKMLKYCSSSELVTA